LLLAAVLVDQLVEAVVVAQEACWSLQEFLRQAEIMLLPLVLVVRGYLTMHQTAPTHL
jgi:hypothetical protein